MMTRRLGNLGTIVEQSHQAVRVQLCEGEGTEAMVGVNKQTVDHAFKNELTGLSVSCCVGT
jgi:hypothetical protein